LALPHNAKSIEGNTAPSPNKSIQGIFLLILLLFCKEKNSNVLNKKTVKKVDFFISRGEMFHVPKTLYAGWIIPAKKSSEFKFCLLPMSKLNVKHIP
jgi:hypothetical protein